MLGYKEYALFPPDDELDDIEGGAAPVNYYDTHKLTDPSGKKIDVYKKLPFKDYKTHGIDPKRPFPFLTRDYNEDDVILDFLQLKLLNVSNTTLTNYPESKMGNIANGFYFDKERMNTLSSSAFTHPKTGERKKVSKLDLWNDLETRKKIYERAYHLRHKDIVKDGNYDHSKPDDMFQHLRGVQLRPAMEYLTDTQNQFKAYVAKVIYNHFKPKKVFDFSAGFAGRCLGALSLNLDYIGIDSNTNLIEPYDKMLDVLSPYYNSTATIIFSQAENIDPKQFDYDFILTSPPYWNTKKKGQTETYSNMEDYSEKAFFDKFLIPTACGAFKHLPENKYMVLNTYEDNILILEKYIGKHKFKFLYKTKQRAHKKEDDEEGKGKRYAEFCYVYQRTEKTIKEMEKALETAGIKLGKYGSAKEVIRKKGNGSQLSNVVKIKNKLFRERTERKKERGLEDTLEDDTDEEEEEEEPQYEKPKSYKNINASVAKVKEIQLQKAPDIATIPEYKTIHLHTAHIRNVEPKGKNTNRRRNHLVRRGAGFLS